MVRYRFTLEGDRTMNALPTDLHWWPYPGHHEGQARAHIFYASSTYRGMTVELYEREDRWDWSFYDDKSDDPDLAVARGSESDTFPGGCRKLLVPSAKMIIGVEA